ncbi:MAG TPA: tetratricopeptide repeat protein [Desulfuromonadaceae bacterium]
MTDAQKRTLYWFGAIILLIGAVYCTTLTHSFVWDDNDIIVNNPLLENLANIPKFFLTEDTIDEATGYYRPITYISFALDRAIWGVNPVGFHLTNLLLHMAAVLIFYRTVAALFNRERLALIAALIFALHPLTVETVNFLSGGRNTLLSACFGLLSLLCHIRNRRLLAVACFALAIFSKEFALLLPLIFLLYDLRLRAEKHRYLTYIPYAVAVALYLTLRSLAVQQANFLSAFNVFHTLAAPYLVARYALNMIIPTHLQVMYDIHPRLPILLVGMVAGALVLSAVYRFRKHTEIFISLCWFFLFLLPIINIIPINSASLMADRYAYFSLMGFAVFLAALICMANLRVSTVCVAIVIVVYAGIDISRNRIWKDEVAFYTRMTDDAPRKFIGPRNLGLYYYRNGDIERAVSNLEAADYRPDMTVKYMMGDVYIFWKENRLEKAEKLLLRAVEENPANPEPYLLLMMIADQKGNARLAASYRDKLTAMGLNIEQILADRAFELCRTGENFLAKRHFVSAEICLWQALRITPSFIPALIDMGSLRAQQDNLPQAIQFFSKVLALDPSNATARNNLAMVYQMQEKSATARQEMGIQQKKGGLAPP